MASKISMVKFKLSGGLTHLPGNNIVDIPYMAGDNQAEFSTVIGINVLFINGGINVARAGKTIVDSTRTFLLDFQPTFIRLTWLDPTHSIGDTDDLVLGLNMLSNPMSIGTSDSEKVKVSATDTTADFLASKLGVFSPLSMSLVNPGGFEQLEINVVDNPEFAGVSHMGVPAGLTADRPGAPMEGFFRGNVDLGRPEMFIGGAWFPMVGPGDLGSMAVQDAGAVAITGGSLSNVTLTNVTITSLATPITVPQGGTGLTTVPAHALVVGNGVNPLVPLATGAAGQFLTSGGPAADPVWASNLGLSNIDINGAPALGDPYADLLDRVPIYDVSILANRHATVKQIVAPKDYVIYFASGFYTKATSLPTNVEYLTAHVWGGGGGGAGGYNAAGQERRGAGGGGGGYSAKRILTSGLAASVTVTVGGGGAGGAVGAPGTAGATGGTSSFGAYCSATGGGGGSVSGPADAAGGAGGNGAGGEINIPGGNGGLNSPAAGSPTIGWRGEGGGSPRLGYTNAGNVAVPGTANLGNGGTGGNQAGGNGGPGGSGFVLVEW